MLLAVLYLMDPDPHREDYDCGLCEVVFIIGSLKLSFQACSDDSGLDEIDFISTFLKVSFQACKDLISLSVFASQ
jgi:hypothetical protein